MGNPRVPGGAEDEIISGPPLETGRDTTLDAPPEEHPHGNYDVKFKSASESDASYDVDETNPKASDG